MLPFISPDDNFHLNLGIVLIVTQTLGESSRGALKLNNERLHIYTYLVKNPVKLNLFLNVLGKGSALISPKDAYSVTSISSNVDPLFDRRNLKALITTLVGESLISVIYKKKDGFFYKLSDSGLEKANQLNTEYFYEVRLLCDTLKSTLSSSTSSLNKALNQVMQKEIVSDGK